MIGILIVVLAIVAAIAGLIWMTTLPSWLGQIFWAAAMVAASAGLHGLI